MGFDTIEINLVDSFMPAIIVAVVVAAVKLGVVGLVVVVHIMTSCLRNVHI